MAGGPKRAPARNWVPKSKGAQGEKGFRPPLTEAEVTVIKEWVEAGKPKEVKRDFISQTDVLKAILDDLNAVSENQRGFFRYLTLSNLHNQTDAEGRSLIPDLDPHRAAVGKLINSLSMNAKITVAASPVPATGRITRKKDCTLVQPSISAASSSSVGMPSM